MPKPTAMISALSCIPDEHFSRASEHLTSTLEALESDRDAARFLLDYTTFNADFAGCALLLAGSLHLNARLFVARDDGIPWSSDRSSVIASHVLYAAEEEFHGERRADRTTHRMMAQRIVREVLAPLLGSSCAPSSSLVAIRKSIRHVYSASSIDDDAALFRALGFHVASERSGADEFAILDQHLRNRRPRLFSQLNEVDPAGQRAYDWVSLHTAAEPEHHAHAVTAVEMACALYVGSLSQEAIAFEIAKGVREFFEIFRIFLELHSRKTELTSTFERERATSGSVSCR